MNKIIVNTQAELNKKTKSAVNALSETLEIAPPKIIWADAGAFRTPTTLAALSENGKEILLNRTLKAREDFYLLIFSIAHELRHRWQMLNRPNLFRNYRPSDEVHGIDEYNEQAAEIDANAWAILVMEKLFGVRPTLEKSLSPEIMSKIEQRKTEIITLGGF